MIEGRDLMDDFEKLYRTYFQYVYFYILRLSNNQQVAEEITQETFFTAMNTKAQFENKSDVRTWLCKSAHNKYISLLRKQKKLAEYTMEDKSAAEMDILEKIIKREDSLKIHRYLHQLEEPYKEVFSLRVFSELSFKDIGRIFEKSDAWARVTYSRAKMKLAERMGEDENKL